MRRRFIVTVSSLKEMKEYAPPLARCVTAALMVSHGLRGEADLVLHELEGGFSVHFTQRVRGVRPDEASVMGILARAFRAAECTGEAPRSVYSGVIVCRGRLQQFLTGFPGKWLCDTQGLELRQLAPSGDPVAFIVPLDAAPQLVAVTRLKCPIDLLWPDQLISLINVWLDRAAGGGACASRRC